ncbi:MAG: RNA-protein complex protein Nop10 [Thermoprotei archaeon]
MHKCGSCGIYTLKNKCPRCSQSTQSAHPPKFSPEDKYLKLKFRTTYEKWLNTHKIE